MRPLPPESVSGGSRSREPASSGAYAPGFGGEARVPRPSARLIVVLGLWAGIFTWSMNSVIPGGDLDDSWRAALYLAHERDLRFGSQIDFTFGPLGFLAQPYIFSPLLGLAAWVVTSGLHLLLCIAIAITAARHEGWLVKVWLLAMGAVASLYIPPLASMSCVLVMLLFLQPERLTAVISRRRDYTIIGLVASLASIGLLVKINDGLVMLAIGLAFSLMFPAWRRSLLTFLTALAATTGVIWVVAGQRLSDLGAWARASGELLLGYSSAMATPGIEGYPRLDAGLMDVVTVLAGLIALLLVFREARRWRPVDALVVLAAFGFFVFQGYKEGTVRHAPMGLLASLFVVVAWMVPWSRLTGRLRPLALSAAGVALLVALQFNPAALQPVDRVTAALRQVTTLVDAQVREEPIAVARANLRDRYAVPSEMLSRIGTAPLHVAPYDAAVVWAYPDLAWSPLPVFQAYAAYTAYLDGLNAATLASADGPEFVLRRPNATIDGRSEWYEAPRSMLALACNFDEVVAEGQWQLLERRPDRCSAPRHTQTLKVRPGEAVAIPLAPEPGWIVTVRIHGLDTDPIERLRTFLASSLIWTITLSDGTSYRLVPKTADGPLIVAGAPDSIYGEPDGPPSTGTFVITAGDAVAVPFDDQPDIELVIDFEIVALGR